MVNRMIVAGATREEIDELLPFARAFSAVRNQPLCLFGWLNIQVGDSLSAGARPAQALRQELEELARGDDAQTVVSVTHDPWRELHRLAGDESDSLLLLKWTPQMPDDFLHSTPCDVVVLAGCLRRKLRRILLPIRGGPYAALALQAALAMAQAYQAQITLLHASQLESAPEAPSQEFLAHLDDLPEITRRVQIRGDAGRAIAREARTRPHQLIVMGASARPEHPSIGPTVRRVIRNAGVPTLIVKTRRAFRVPPQANFEPADYTISVLVDKWFGENTFSASEFENVRHLVELKERQGLTISLGLPALNEEKTIGKVIRAVRPLMESYHLLDEVVVIDSNSTDDTVAIAQGLGVPVHRHPEILRSRGAHVGKGETLWKSLHVLKGDLIAWIDTDIVNIHPRFVYGVLGPLIRDAELMYVKGFYQRPLRVGGKIEARSGGRVTELVARPLLNLFYPALSGLIQPLSGEYAGRREALESVPFFTGYGVEIGLLIDILERYGLRAIGQVDLQERVHRNQPLTALGKMSFAIIQVVMQRVGASNNIALMNAMNASLKLIRYEPDQFRLDIQEIHDHERPPIITLPEYRRARRGATFPR